MREAGTKNIVSIFAAMMCVFSATEMFAAVDSNGICIVENGRAKSVIVLAESSAMTLNPDVQLLIRSIEKSTGATIPVGTVLIGRYDYFNSIETEPDLSAFPEISVTNWHCLDEYAILKLGK